MIAYLLFRMHCHKLNSYYKGSNVRATEHYFQDPEGFLKRKDRNYLLVAVTYGLMLILELVLYYAYLTSMGH